MLDTLRDHAVLVVAILAVLEGILCAYLLRRMESLRRRLDIAIDAAEDAARAAAMAAPGGIDPELVVGLLRDGRPVTLDSVHEVMNEAST